MNTFGDFDSQGGVAVADVSSKALEEKNLFLGPHQERGLSMNNICFY
ncbi:hypothetical protein N836_17335 [Leptolyngbya sp. Heron Island J]|nr:hypothetical protein N836_17335 [Leptolyngbya sp. Heron Island J]